MKREDIQTNRVYQCSTPTFTPSSFSNNRTSIGLCKVVEIPPSGQEVLVKQVNSRLEPVGKTMAARLCDIRIAGEYDIERAIKKANRDEADQAWQKVAKKVRADFAPLLRKYRSAKLDLPVTLPYEYYYKNPPKPEEITSDRVEAHAKVTMKGADFLRLARAARLERAPSSESD